MGGQVDMTQVGLKDNSAQAEEELTMNLGYEPVHLRFVGPMIRHDPTHLPTRGRLGGFICRLVDPFD